MIKMTTLFKGVGLFKGKRDMLDYNSGKMSVSEMLDKYKNRDSAIFFEINEETKKELNEVLKIDIDSILKKPIIYLESGRYLGVDETYTFYIGEIYTEMKGFFKGFNFSYAFNNDCYQGVTLRKKDMLKELNNLKNGTIAMKDFIVIKQMIKEKKEQEEKREKRDKEKKLIEEIKESGFI